ncbi:MAG: flagellar basal body L-ring protein FlgH [Steroidobacteraceae bacterium]
MKQSEQFLALSAGIALVLLLSACAARPPQVENYDATWPEETPSAEHANGAIYQAGRDVALFENAVARRVGDTVTINLVENTAAQKSSSTKTSKSSTIDLPGPTLLGNPVTINGNAVLEANIANSRKFDGSGDSQLSNQLQGFITVTVARRLTNGNLLVRGQKWIGINQGREFVRIQGVIRPIDIQPDNSIPSYKVADATISYGGQGALADANRPGLLSRFFNSIWNPL